MNVIDKKLISIYQQRIAKIPELAVNIDHLLESGLVISDIYWRFCTYDLLSIIFSNIPDKPFNLLIDGKQKRWEWIMNFNNSPNIFLYLEPQE